MKPFQSSLICASVALLRTGFNLYCRNALGSQLRFLGNLSSHYAFLLAYCSKLAVPCVNPAVH